MHLAGRLFERGCSEREAMSGSRPTAQRYADKSALTTQHFHQASFNKKENATNEMHIKQKTDYVHSRMFLRSKPRPRAALYFPSETSPALDSQARADE
jgi:hypothetical protein